MRTAIAVTYSILDARRRRRRQGRLSFVFFSSRHFSYNIRPYKHSTTTSHFTNIKLFIGAMEFISNNIYILY